MLLATASVIQKYRFDSIRCIVQSEFDSRVATSIECTTNTIDLVHARCGWAHIAMFKKKKVRCLRPPYDHIGCRQPLPVVAYYIISCTVVHN